MHSKKDKKRIVRDPKIKRLYNSHQWQVLRANQLARAPWCADCLKLDRYVFATDVDHIVRHEGDPKLFFDETNLQSLCKPHHSSKTANEVWHDA